MKKPEVPLDETVRLVSLHSLRILDSDPEERFDRITRMAKRLFDVDICLVSLVDSDRQWFKSKQGLDACETPRDVSFCGHAILDDKAFVIEDAHCDPRFVDNPLVQADPNIRFYAGYPVHGPNGKRIGTLCLIDAEPRPFSQKDEQTLRDFAALVDDELDSASQINVDELTNVANRRGFRLVANHLLPLCRRNELDVELIYFDLDGFKAINDELGHDAGDQALRTFAKILLKSFRNADVIARLGGDEFAVLLAGSRESVTDSLTEMDDFLEQTQSEACRRLEWSVGRISYDPNAHDDIDGLLKDADGRMYEQKIGKRRQ